LAKCGSPAESENPGCVPFERGGKSEFEILAMKAFDAMHSRSVNLIRGILAFEL
jgi:hypothetical protein